MTETKYNQGKVLLTLYILVLKAIFQFQSVSWQTKYVVESLSEKEKKFFCLFSQELQVIE